MAKNKRGIEKKKLFDIFSKNLSLVNNDYADLFACPICCEGFTTDQIDLLNFAHTWPKSLGGNEVTLSCIKCNSRMGESIEGDTGRYNRYMRSEKFRVIITVPNMPEKLSADIWKSSEKLDLIEESSNPALYKAAREGLLSKLSAYQVRPHHTVQYDLKNVELTYLHFAYLHLFHNFGYEFIFTPLGRLIRQQLSMPDQITFNSSVSYIPQDKLSRELESKSIYHYVIYKPLGMLGFSVVSPELGFLPGHRALVKFFMGRKFNDNTPSEEEYSLVRLHNSHELLTSEHAPYASRFILFTVLMDQGVVNSNDEASELVKNAYIHKELIGKET